MGDTVRCSTIRRIVNTTATGSTDSTRVRTTLTILVAKADYSPSTSTSSGTINAAGNLSGLGNADSGSGAVSTGAVLQLNGKVTSQNDLVKMGSFHKIDIEVGKDFTLIKEKGGWDSVAVERIEEVCVEGRGAEVAALILSEDHATICVLTEYTTIIKQRLEGNIPKKRRGIQAMAAEKVGCKTDHISECSSN